MSWKEEEQEEEIVIEKLTGWNEWVFPYSLSIFKYVTLFLLHLYEDLFYYVHYKS